MATFTNKKGIEVLQTMLKEYIYEALEIAKSGQKVNFKEDQKLNFPEELEAKFNENLDFKNAFNNLTPGRQRGYVLHFSRAKQSKTRISRIEKYQERLFHGKGFHDCVCGLSKKMPSCDGSHNK